MGLDPEYVAKYREKERTFAAFAARARAIYLALKTPLLRYRGGMPAGAMAAIAEIESGGRMDAPGDPDLGEAGYFQITSSFPTSVGVDPSVRLAPEGNVFLAGLEYQIEAVRTSRMSSAVTLGTLDSWRLARLAFAVGSSGTKRLLAAARPSIAGQAFAGVLAWADATGAMALSSGQPAGKVWYRIKMTELAFRAGALAAPPFFGGPARVPAPSGIAYHFPADVAGYFSVSVVAPILALAAAGALISLA
jgi:hypothetical protein